MTGISLKSIAEYICDYFGVDNYDFTDLADVMVQGWVATRGQGTNMLEPLFDAYACTLRMNGFTLEGFKRGVDPTNTLVLADDAVYQYPLYKVTQKQPIDLPRSLTISFSDVGIDLQPNTSRDVRGDQTGIIGDDQSIDMSTWASDTDESQQVTNRMFRRIWNTDNNATFNLPNHYFALLPGDPWALDADTLVFAAVPTKITYDFSNDNLQTEWEEDFASLASLDGTTGPGYLGSDPAVILVPIGSVGSVLDIPYPNDIDNDVNPLLFMTVAPDSTTGWWPGGVMYSPDDGDFIIEEHTFTTTEICPQGVTTNALPTSDPAYWDYANHIDVVLTWGSLTSISEAAADADFNANLVYVAGEIIQYQTATLTAPLTYTLTGLRRAMRGTEQFLTTHTIGDEVVFLENRYGDERALSEVGTNLSFEPVTAGTADLTTTGEIDITPFTGATLKPYAVVNVVAVWSGSDIDFTWERRTRLGGSWTSGTTVPLSEASEAYEIDVMSGTTVVNTYTGITSPSWTYLSADQTTDFGSPQTTVKVRIYQMSDAVGRGFVSEHTFTA